MECQALRGVFRYRGVHAAAAHALLTRLGSADVAAGRLSASDRRLYHRDSWHPQPSASACSRFRRMRFFASPALSVSANSTFVLRPPQTRTVLISKAIDALRSADLTSIEGVSKFILQSTPVTAAASVYEWTEAVTGLPWAANILLCSSLLQLIFNVPANVYLAKWMTAKEKHAADMVAIKSSVMRAPTREGIAMVAKTHSELTRHYGCQNYKFFSSIFYQFVHVTISSFAIRSLLLNPNLDTNSGLLPWGPSLGSPDLMLILPIVNVAVSLLLVEIGAWKKLGSEAGLKMTLKRAGMPFKPEPLYLLNLRRFCSVPIVVIYLVVPSALTLHWFTMVAISANAQILLTHRRTRRMLGVPQGYFETDNPYRDLLQHLRKDVRVFGKKD